jgi:hypothetical protein
MAERKVKAWTFMISFGGREKKRERDPKGTGLR